MKTIFRTAAIFLIFFSLCLCSGRSVPYSEEEIQHLKNIWDRNVSFDDFQPAPYWPESKRLDSIVLINTNPDGTLSISDPKGHILIRNTSDEDFIHDDSNIFLEFFEDGVWYTVPRTVGGRTEPGRGPLTPGKEWELFFPYCEKERLKIPGHYRIVVDSIYLPDEGVLKGRAYLDAYGILPRFEFALLHCDLDFRWTAIEVDIVP